MAMTHSQEAMRSKTWVWCRWFAGIAGSSPTRRHGYLFKCFMLSDFSATSWSLFQGCPTDCDASLCMI